MVVPSPSETVHPDDIAAIERWAAGRRVELMWLAEELARAEARAQEAERHADLRLIEEHASLGPEVADQDEAEVHDLFWRGLPAARKRSLASLSRSS